MSVIEKCVVKEITEDNQLQMEMVFPTSVYLIKKPAFLDRARSAAAKALKNAKAMNQPNEAYPVCHSTNLLEHVEIAELAEYIGSTGWNILESQGYKMDDKEVFFESMWCQEHKKLSGMDQHVHPNNFCQLVGFYVLDCPPDEECPRLLVHDPRPGKVQISLDEMNMSNATHASNTINYKPEPGLLVFTNAWLPHSITRNPSKKPFRVIHFNLGVQYAKPKVCQAPAEVV
jgi:uncharacterized protein (TIGR02466 family)